MNIIAKSYEVRSDVLRVLQTHVVGTNIYFYPLSIMDFVCSIKASDLIAKADEI